MLDFIKPERPNWRHYFGSLALLMLILQIATGLILTAFYEPTLQNAYKSVQLITNQIPGGSLSRNLHRWIAFALFAAILVHILRSTLRKDFMNPHKKIEWMTGVLLVWPLFLLVYTGLILPWEWKGYWFMEMIPSYAAKVPVLGPDLKAFFLMEFTVPRYYVIHILLLPLICFILVDYHFLTVLRKRGIFRHLSRHTVITIPFIIALVALSIYITIPTKDPDEIPMPLEGAWIPAPEWYGLLPLLPFKYFAGPLVTLLAIYIPALLFFALAFIPFVFRSKKKEEAGIGAEPAANYDNGAEDSPLNGPDAPGEEREVPQPVKKTGFAMAIVRGVIVFIVFAVVFGLIYLGNYESPTYGCNSCHNLSRGFRMGVPPDTFKDRRTLPNLDDDKWMMGHWYYPNEIY